MEILEIQEPLWALFVRPIIIYFFALFMMRVLGKREIGQMTPFDLVVLLILSEGLQAGLIGQEQSIVGSLIIAATLLGLNAMLGLVSLRSQKFEMLVSGTPTLAVYKGKIIKGALDKEKMTISDLMEKLRGQSIFDLEEVDMAIIEADGSVSVKTQDEKQQSGGNQQQEDAKKKLS